MTAQRYDDGLAVRKAVLGEDYVNAALNRANDFNGPLQDLVTQFCWGAVWTRDGLPRKVRSLLNIGMLVALNRPHELKTYVQGAVRNGCTREEIREALLQAAVY
ncbi:MAG: 4-carboxymuconolactone decarboxylase, partial [Nitriliruptorales bacterium]|nr:4-carboxymuconolactone decarboxylase [Nitriliruptorales bacterium]